MNQLAFDTRTLKPTPADKLMADALAWIRDNPEAWRYLVDAARLDADAYGRIRIKSCIETLRFKRIPHATETIKLPNAFSAPFGRILREWHGHEPIRGNSTLADCIPLHRSKVDGCSVPPRPY